MNRHVNSLAGRMSLREPQRASLEILDRVCEIAPPHRKYLHDSAALQDVLQSIQSEYPSVQSFEREFPSLCFALATGVGKTRLMGAFIAYLHLAHSLNNFFVLAPNLTIYNKLIQDFTPNTPKYVFKGIAEFSLNAPEVITGENYEQRAGGFGELFNVRVNIFNISKINSEVRGGKAPRIKRLSEYIGQSYFDYLAELQDLVLLMDESHRYRASAGVRAINELKPVLGLELTATPIIETSRGAVPFQNVIYDYALGRAMSDGFVKDPAVVTRKDFNAANMSTEEIEKLKLEDGIRLHESIKVELQTYARENAVPIVKPFVLVIARDTTHAASLLNYIESEEFFGGSYKGKAIQVDSSQSGANEEKMIQALLNVERPDEPTEFVIHVNMLKEGWDVTNLYTIVPLRAANARVLIEQSIGRGLRLPYGKRVGVRAVDTLNIVAHDKFQEIVDEANREGSVIKLQQIVLDDQTLNAKTQTMVSHSQVDVALGLAAASTSDASTDTESTLNAEIASTQLPASTSQLPKTALVFASPEEQKIARIAHEVIRETARQRDEKGQSFIPTAAHLQQPQVQAAIQAEVEKRLQGAQLELEGTAQSTVEIGAVVAKTADFIAQQTIDIPRIIVQPKDGQSQGGRYRAFTLDLSNFNYQAPSQELFLKSLHSGNSTVLGLHNAQHETRLEDYIIAALFDCDDISYDDNAEVINDLATQVVGHLLSYLYEDGARRVLRVYQREIGRAVRAQMLPHFVEEKVETETIVREGLVEIKPSVFTAVAGEAVRPLSQAPAAGTPITRYVYGHFQKCLQDITKFDSDAERKLALILEREAEKWFRPAKGQFQLYYGPEHHQYQPDFVAETEDTIYMLEPKKRADLESADVQAKAAVAREWCERASTHNAQNGGKPWKYALIPHDAIAENMSLLHLTKSIQPL